MRSTLSKLSQQEKEQQSVVICERLVLLIKDLLDRSSVIATFAGLSSEPDLSSLHGLLAEHEFVYPRCSDDGGMEFYRVKEPQLELSKGLYGIREPRPLIENRVNSEDVDLFLVPAFAYTIGGQRLGKGGGYYDRLFEKVVPKNRLIGVVFSKQLLEFVPEEWHDVAVSRVVVG